MAVSAQDVKALRERTGIGMMDCKRALDEADGDVEAAIHILRKKGLATAAKRGGRAASEGRVAAKVSDDGVAAAIVEVNCESDFVAKGDDFGELVDDVLDHVLAAGAADVDELLARPYLKDEARTLGAVVTDAVAKLGENTIVGRFERLDVAAGEAVGAYTHFNHSVAALVKASVSDESAAAKPEVAAALKDVVMHVTFAKPIALTHDEIPADVVEKEKEIYREQIKDKPAELQDKIISGKLKGFFKENCLPDQPFFKEPKMSVAGYLEEVGKKVGAEIELVEFVCFELGDSGE